MVYDFPEEGKEKGKGKMTGKGEGKGEGSPAAARATRVSCLRLDWTRPQTFPADLRADLLLGSDLVYDRNILRVLVPAVKRLLSDGQSCSLIVDQNE